MVKTERERNHLEDSSENGRIILKFVLKDTQVFLQLITEFVSLFLHVAY